MQASESRRRRAWAQSTEEDTMERFSSHPTLRRVLRPLLLGVVSVLALAVLAAAGMAATNRVSAAPSNTQPPVVSGTAEVGKELSTTNGSWSGSTPLTFGYQWRRCDKTGGGCANISEATDNTYKLQAADGGNTVRVVVTAKNSDGSDIGDQRPDRRCCGCAGFQQRLSGRQERQDGRDRSTRRRRRGYRSSPSTCSRGRSTGTRTASR